MQDKSLGSNFSMKNIRNVLYIRLENNYGYKSKAEEALFRSDLMSAMVARC